MEFGSLATQRESDPSAAFPPRIAPAGISPGFGRNTGFPRVTAVIPTLNEEQNLRLLLPEIGPEVHEIVIVDGHSTDETLAVARELRPDAVVVTQTGRGKGDAMRCGFAAATGDIIVMMDADGSADPAEVPRFVDALLAGADFAKGTRFGNGGGSADITPLRAAGNRVLNTITNVVHGTRFTDLCYGYNAFWRHCLDTMAVDCSGFEIETLINIRVGRSHLSVQEVPSYERLRVHGESNLRTFRDGTRVLRTIVTERLRAASLGPVGVQPDYATE